MYRCFFNLDLEEKERWVNILNKFENMKLEIREFVQSLFINVNYDKYINVVDKMLLENKIRYSDEIKYIAKFFNLTFIEILLLQLFYEAHAACSVGMLNIKGKMFYFRTLDWNLEFLKKITIELDIIKNGVIVGTAVTWIGYIGFPTCNVNDMYNIALNYRFTKPMNNETLKDNINKTVNLYWPITYLIRNVLEQQMLFSEAVDTFCNSKLISPCYISMFSKYSKSVIITRDFDSLVNIRDYNLVQTNCDFDKNEPNVTKSVERRELIYKVEKDCNMYNIIKYEDILNMLLQPPVLTNRTIYFISEYKGKKKSHVLN